MQHIRLWQTHTSAFARNFLPLQYDSLQDAPTATRTLAEQSALDAIDRVLFSFGLSNAQVGLPAATPRSALTQGDRDFFAPQQHRLRTASAHARTMFTPQQHHIREAILQSILAPTVQTSKLYLIQGRAGRGKTFVVQGIVNALEMSSPLHRYWQPGSVQLAVAKLPWHGSTRVIPA
ncbi:hypothetical protein A4X13_0g7906 [Tilletia indica]|uniref:ATP-dependent DNA helicase n=1 Tax=Tilletia indica TaxID=43049 RepID=A0A177T6E4_9BASI|nr:hypothetical protein A4X13_0g7906 [Tilletia indica]